MRILGKSRALLVRKFTDPSISDKTDGTPRVSVTNCTDGGYDDGRLFWEQGRTIFSIGVNKLLD